MPVNFSSILYAFLYFAFFTKLNAAEVTQQQKNGTATLTGKFQNNTYGANGTSSFVITNAQTKTVSPADLPNTQLKEVEKEKSSQEKIDALSSVGKSNRSRNIYGTTKESNGNVTAGQSKNQPKQIAEGLKLPKTAKKNDKLNDTTIVSKTNLTTPATTTTTSTTITTTSTTTTTTTSTTTTTTTTPKPKKPLITLGFEDLSDLDVKKVNEEAAAEQANSKLPQPEPVAPVFPNAEPSQEFMYHRNRDYIVPILTVMFTVPLLIGILITAYRRFRDYWSTRHYRRMDFLVDGMYNE